MSVIGDGFDLLKLVDKGVNAELYKQLGDWIDKVASLQKQVEALTAKNLQLEEQLRFKGAFQRIAGHTFADGDDEEICDRCAQVDFRPVRLMEMNIDGQGKRAACPQCRTARAGFGPISRKQAERVRSNRH